MTVTSKPCITVHVEPLLLTLDEIILNAQVSSGVVGRQVTQLLLESRVELSLRIREERIDVLQLEVVSA